MIGVANIGSLNARILEGGGSDLIRIAEALHEKALGTSADRIYAESTGTEERASC